MAHFPTRDFGCVSITEWPTICAPRERVADSRKHAFPETLRCL